MASHTVIIFLEALPGKETDLEKLLTELAIKSREESSCIEYKLHKNAEQTRQFITYETWESQDKHKEQFDKPYVKELGSKLPPLLSQPFAAYFANELVI